MSRFLRLLVVFVTLASPVAAQACPSCREALASNDTGSYEDVNQLPMMYNVSIYLMLGVCYGLLGGVGFMIYRGVKKNEAYLASIRQGQAAEPTST